MNSQQDKRPRRWLQFSLRGLLVLMLVVAMGLGWIANERRKVWLEDRAVEEIERLGGDVTRGFNSKSSWAANDPFGGSVSEGLSWQQRLFGESYNRPVVCVSFPRGIELEDLGSLKYLRALWAIGLTGTRIGDEQIPHLLECRGLTAVHLNATNVTDNGVKQLASLPNLDTLLLDHTGVTDDVLAALSQKALIDISIRDTDITPEGAARLAKSQPHPEAEFLYAPSPSRSHREAVKRLVQLGADFPDTAPGADFPSPDAVLVMLHDGSISHHAPWTGCPQDLELLTQLESKLCLSLDFTLCTKEYLQQLAASDTAEEVWLESMLPAREIGECLANMENLESLHITFAPYEEGTFRSLRDGELDFLAELANLQDFALRIDEGFGSSLWTEVSRSALHAIARCQNLKHLSINRVDIHEETLARIVESLKLETFYVGNTRTIPREVLLTLWGVDLSKCNQLAFREMSRLRSLKFDGLGENDFDLKTIGPLPSLEVMSLSDVHLSDEEFDVLTHFANLRSLEIHDIPLGAEHLRRLARLQKLEVLTFEISDPSRFPKCGLTRASLEHLRKLPNLRKVKLPWDYGLDNATVTGFGEEIRTRGVARDEKNTPASDRGQ